jgi:CheY-like chemotaxis protein
MRFLIIDDDRAYRELATILLEDGGHSVASTPGLDEALQAVQRETFDVILLDMHLRGMNGFQVVDKLQQDSHASGTPIIGLTAAVVEGSEQQRALEAGFRAFLTKPVTKAEFGNLLEELSRHR